MSLYMQQMLCLVSEDFNHAADFEAQHLQQGFDAVLDTLGFVHFASLALLPGLPDPQRPALMLELAIDDDIAPQDAVERLADAALDVLWPLYMDNEAPPPAERAPDREARRQRLADKLRPLAERARAGGGFIGMRDRSAVQVRTELRWFHLARSRLQAIRRQALAAGEQPDATDLVQRLIVAMEPHPDHATMKSPPPVSFWATPRPLVLQLFLALAWLVLPLPLLVLVLTLLGWETRMVIETLVSITQALAGDFDPWGAVFFVGAAASLALLMLLALVVALFRTGALSGMATIIVAALAGILLFNGGLVAGYLKIPPPVGATVHPLTQPLALWGEAGVLLAFLLAWLLAGRRDGDPVPPAWARVLAIGGATLSAYLFGAAWNNVACFPRQGLPWNLAAYVGPWLLAMLLIARSSAARWYFALVLPLLVVLLLLGGLVFRTWPALASEWLWTAAEIRQQVLLGVISLADLLLVVGAVLLLWLLALLRPPRAPLGVPLGLGFGLLLGLHLLAGCAALWVLRRLDGGVDWWSLLRQWQSYAWLLAGLVVVAVLILVAMQLVVRMLPNVIAWMKALDRRPSDEPFRPCLLHPSIVASEASLFDRPSHMISLTDVRGMRHGWHWLMIWLWLHVVGEAGSLLFTQGWLGTAWGIKFGHWHLVQGGRRLLFLSNFDGDFGGYLDEFINGASQGINLIWRWTHLAPRAAVSLPGAPQQPGVAAGEQRHFPPTLGLAFAGCHHEQAFKAYARASMLPHLYLYQAYGLSNHEIQRCTQLRAALAGERTPLNDNLVLRILES